MSSRRSSAAPVVLEATAILPFTAYNGSGVASAADSTPTYEIRTAAGLGDGTSLATGSCAAASGVTGGYYVGRALTAALGFAAGTNYYCLISYSISSVAFTEWIDIPVA